MSRLAGQRILLVNDDGIDAPGLGLLEALLREVCDELWVVAPDEERSGASHSISVSLPLRVRKLADRRFAVKGTPTDCLLMAHYEIMRAAPPTLVLSGINRGANLGEDVTYSGTTAAALEGALLGLPAVAFSQIFTFGHEPHWATAERYSLQVLELLLDQTWRAGLYFNVNFPDRAPEAVTGLQLATQGQRPPGAFVPERGIDGRDHPYYWIRLAYPQGDHPPETDLAATAAGRIAVTPLQADLTARDAMESCRASFAQADAQFTPYPR